MTDFYEIDFLEVHTSKSGDAITIRYEINGNTFIHVVDAGYASTGPDVVRHINEHYQYPGFIDHLIVSHPDGDHAGGIVSILESFAVGKIWLLCPWNYAEELVDRFSTYNSVERLRSRLKTLYPHLAKIYNKAQELGVPIGEPFQGTYIGAFQVLAPSRNRFLDLVVDADRTPVSTAKAEAGLIEEVYKVFWEVAKRAVSYVTSFWGEEIFSEDEVSCENEMSVVQFAVLNGQKILLTADAGRGGLDEAITYAPFAGLVLPGVNVFQVPHHGSRRNLSVAILDRILGPKLDQGDVSEGRFFAVISAASNDPEHPRKSVVRAMHHRGADVASTEDGTVRTSFNAPLRKNWSKAPLLPYPQEQEE